jgi:MOSC domain-containing protein YiiM
MKLLSLNVSLPRTVLHRGQPIQTGIFKEPREGQIHATRLHLEGDGQADLTVHGGLDKAIYAFPFEHYAFYQSLLGRRDFSWGQFGENFTTTGLMEETVRIGDRFRVGEIVVEVSQPRAPCFKLGLRMNDPSILKTFVSSLKTGFYLRVIEEGLVGAGDRFERIRTDPQSLTVREVARLYFIDESNRDGAARAAALPALSGSWRDVFAERKAPSTDRTGIRGQTG